MSRSVLLTPFCFFSTQIASFGKILYVDHSASGSNNGSSWGNGFQDLQLAITEAEEGDEIWVAKGTYLPGESRTNSFHLKSGVAMYGGFPAGGSDGGFEARNFEAFETILL